MAATRNNAIYAGTAFIVLFVGSIALVMLVNIGDTNVRIPGTELAWWKTTLIYHVYVPSFYDSNGDGLGDIKGMTFNLYRKHTEVYIIKHLLTVDNTSMNPSLFGKINLLIFSQSI